MWAGADNWIHDAAEAWPVLASIGGFAIWVVTWFARTKSNDKELVALTGALKDLTETVDSVVEKLSKLQGNVEFGASRVSEACLDIKACREAINKNSGEIQNILGRMQQRRQS